MLDKLIPQHPIIFETNFNVILTSKTRSSKKLSDFGIFYQNVETYIPVTPVFVYCVCFKRYAWKA
jgi:hypothetical protein